MSTSSMVLDHSLNSQEPSSAPPELQRESDRLRLLLDMTATLVSTLECRDLLRTVSASIRQVMHCDIVGVWLPDVEHAHLRQLAMDFPGGKGFAKEDALQPIEGSVIGAVFKAGKPIVLDLRSEQLAPGVSSEVRAEALESGCALPLISRGRTLGVLTLGSRVEHSIRSEDVDFLLRAAGQLAIAIDNHLAYREIAELKDKLAQEKLYLEDEIRGELDFEGIVGQSSALRHVLNLVETVAPSDSTVLLLGETGTGKELIARAVHERSGRKERTFVKLNCAAIPSGLVESELFGHERGAFTGALMQKRGRLELADHGSLFLDEIGDISLELQPKLLRALQEQEFERLGSNKTIRVDVRLIAATHRDLSLMIRNNQFREDLFYRLNVFPIEIPPLRERREDIPLLVHYFVSRLSRRMQKRIKSIPKPAMDALSNAGWPGNVRELENFIERAVILTQGDELNVPLAELRKSSVRNTAPVSTFQEAERQAIIGALKAASGRISGAGAAAERLGLKRTTLQNKMRRLNVTKADY